MKGQMNNKRITDALTLVIALAKGENTQPGYTWTDFKKQRAAINTCRRLLKSLQVFQPTKKVKGK